MELFRQNPRILAVILVLSTIVFSPGGWACACGCGIFEVGTGALYPTGTGGKVAVEWDYMDQNQNWSGSAQAPAAGNPDKEVVTSFYKLSGEYMVDHRWGFQVEIPYWDRDFKTLDGDGVTVDDLHEKALGDIRLMGMYTGFSKDMSTGLEFGVKLPTGNSTYFGDADTEIGTGSTDLLLGIYHFGTLMGDSSWTWTGELRLDYPVAYQNGYVPGGEFDASLGVTYRGLVFGDLSVVPLVEVNGSHRLADYGTGDPDNSGYNRILIVPGLDLEDNAWRLFTTVGIPVYQDVTGDQLVAPVLFKALVSYSF